MDTNKDTRGAGHTPGPWSVEQPYGETGLYVTGPNTGLICKLYPPDKHLFNVDKPVSKAANARLIAAAPELLEAVAFFLGGDLNIDVAVERAVLAESYNDRLAREEYLLGRIAAARAALAKATQEGGV